MTLSMGKAQTVLKYEDNQHLIKETITGNLKGNNFKVLIIETIQSRGYQTEYQHRFKGYIIVYKNVNSYMEYKTIRNNHPNTNSWNVNKDLNINISVLGYCSKDNFLRDINNFKKELNGGF